MTTNEGYDLINEAFESMKSINDIYERSVNDFVSDSMIHRLLEINGDNSPSNYKKIERLLDKIVDKGEDRLKYEYAEKFIEKYSH